MFDTGTIHLANDDLLACLIGRGGRVVHHGVADELGDAVGEWGGGGGGDDVTVGLLLHVLPVQEAPAFPLSALTGLALFCTLKISYWKAYPLTILLWIYLGRTRAVTLNIPRADMSCDYEHTWGGHELGLWTYLGRTWAVTMNIPIGGHELWLWTYLGRTWAVTLNIPRAGMSCDSEHT